MTIGREIKRLVDGLDGKAVRDLCLTDRLRLSVPSQANIVTHVLGAEPALERLRDRRGLCNKPKLVIRRAG